MGLETDPSIQVDNDYNRYARHRERQTRRASDSTPDKSSKDFHRMISFSHDTPQFQRETTDLRLSRHQPLPAIGMTSLPENDISFEEDEIGEISEQSSRFISPPNLPQTSLLLPQKRLHDSNSEVDSPRRRTKASLKYNQRNKRFEPMTRRATAGVHTLPPIRRTRAQYPMTSSDVMSSNQSDDEFELPERPDAPAPNRTPPLDIGDGEYARNCSSFDEDDGEPIDYIDED